MLGSGEGEDEGVMSPVFSPAEEQAVLQEARVRHVCLYPAWRQLGATGSLPFTAASVPYQGQDDVSGTGCLGREGKEVGSP